MWEAIRRIASPWALEAPLRGYPPESVGPLAAAALYFALDARGRVRYAGSVCRSGDAMAVDARLKAHLQTRAGAAKWVLVYPLPLMPETPLPVVRELEGRIGRILNPPDNKRLPRSPSRKA